MQEQEIILVDKRAKPGGHWNDAYDFVRLHQPSYSYGVSSMLLGSGDKDLCSKPQILAYFELALKKMEDTGRLKFLPQCEYVGEGKIRSMVDKDLEYDVSVKKKIVDATYLNTSVPSTNPPRYMCAPEITLVPINSLIRINKYWDNFIVIGAGKTGIDAVLYLLDLNVPAERIIWIMPNDSWLFNRSAVFFENVMNWIEGIRSSVLEADNFIEIILKLEKRKMML